MAEFAQEPRMLDRQTPPDRPGQVNKATLRILDVLSIFTRNSSAYGVTELSKALGISKNMAFRTLNTLREQGFVVRDADGSRYQLGYGVLWLQSGGADDQFDIRILCAPFMRRLHEATGESVFLSVILGRNHVTIDSVEAHGTRVSHSPRGLLVPLHASPASRALLAFLSDAEIDAYIRAASPLKRFTATTITEPSKLLDEVRLVRRQRFARGYGDHYAHATYISFPVLDAAGRPHAAITVGAPADRMTEADVDRLLPAMQQIMHELNLRSALHHADTIVAFE